MDDLLAVAGADNVEFPLKTACRGGAHTLSDSDTSNQAGAEHHPRGRGRGCRGDRHRVPTCHSGLEMHQVRAEKKFGQATKVKIVVLTQLARPGAGPFAPSRSGSTRTSRTRCVFFREKGIA